MGKMHLKISKIDKSPGSKLFQQFFFSEINPLKHHEIKLLIRLVWQVVNKFHHGK